MQQTSLFNMYSFTIRVSLVNYLRPITKLCMDDISNKQNKTKSHKIALLQTFIESCLGSINVLLIDEGMVNEKNKKKKLFYPRSYPSSCLW